MRRERIWERKLLLSFCMLAGLFAGNVMMASPAAAALPNCNTAFLSGRMVFPNTAKSLQPSRQTEKAQVWGLPTSASDYQPLGIIVSCF
jgi:hypothetical protein